MSERVKFLFHLYTFVCWCEIYVKNHISIQNPEFCLLGILQLLTDGPTGQTRQQIELCQQAGVSNIVVFLNKCDLMEDSELYWLIELQVRELLSANGFRGDEIPIIRGSARKALEGDVQWVQMINDLLDTMDSYIPTPASTAKKSYLLPYVRALSNLLRMTDKNY